MERRAYWRFFAVRLGVVGGGVIPGQGGGRGGWHLEDERISLSWGGRELSPEAYLAVPTYLRRGLRPAA